MARRKRDDAIRDLVDTPAQAYIQLVFTPQELDEIRDASKNPEKWTPDLNIRAGVIYLLGRMMNGTKTISERTDQNLKTLSMRDLNNLHKGESGYRPVTNLTDFARAVGNTVEELMQQNKDKFKDGDPRKLQDTTPLSYYQAKLKTVPVAWFDWGQDANWGKAILPRYNSTNPSRGDPKYVEKVKKLYDAIKKRWSENSTERIVPPRPSAGSLRK